MEYTIIGYNESDDTHMCIVDTDVNNTWRIDLFVDASFPESEPHIDDMQGKDIIKYRRSLIGKRISIEHLIPYISLAVNVKII